MSWRVCSKSRVKMSGHNPKNSAEHLVFFCFAFRAFLTGRIFQEKIGLGVKNILGKKKKSYEEYFPKISLAKVSFEKNNRILPAEE